MNPPMNPSMSEPMNQSMNERMNQSMNERMKPPMHEVFAIRYARHERTASANFINPPGDPAAAMPLDYFVWLIRSPQGRNVVVDTGFGPEAAARRGRRLMRSPVEALARLGVDASKVEDVVVTHLHCGHAGNIAEFPAARFWLQSREMDFSTGKYMCHAFFRLAYDR